MTVLQPGRAPNRAFAPAVPLKTKTTTGTKRARVLKKNTKTFRTRMTKRRLTRRDLETSLPIKAHPK